MMPDNADMDYTLRVVFFTTKCIRLAQRSQRFDSVLCENLSVLIG